MLRQVLAKLCHVPRGTASPSRSAVHYPMQMPTSDSGKHCITRSIHINHSEAQTLKASFSHSRCPQALHKHFGAKTEGRALEGIRPKSPIKLDYHVLFKHNSALTCEKTGQLVFSSTNYKLESNHSYDSIAPIVLGYTFVFRGFLSARRPSMLAESEDSYVEFGARQETSPIVARQPLAFDHRVAEVVRCLGCPLLRSHE
jgi:hypothetical protein